MSIQLSKFMWCIRNGMKAVEQKYCFDFATHLCHFSLFLFTNFHFCSYILFFDIWRGKLLLAQPKTNEKSFKKLIENSMTHQIHKKLQETKWSSLWWSHKYRFNLSSCDQRAQTSERLKSIDNCVVFHKWAQIGFRSSCIQKWIWNISTFVHKRININVVSCKKILSWQFCNFVDVLSAKLWKRAKKRKKFLTKLRKSNNHLFKIATQFEKEKDKCWQGKKFAFSEAVDFVQNLIVSTETACVQKTERQLLSAKD